MAGRQRGAGKAVTRAARAGTRGTTRIGYLIAFEPELARRQLLEVFRAEVGMPTRVARRLGVDHATVKRWVARLGIRGEIDQIRAKRGRAPTFSGAGGN